jgi:hypothetical protein
MSRRAIAKALRITPNKVFVSLHRFTIKLRKELHVQSFFIFDPRRPYSETYAEPKYYR